MRSAAAPVYETSLWGLFEAALAEAPSRTILSEGGREISVAALDARAGDLARALAAAGLGRGDRVATLMGNHADHVAAILALARLGLVWVPLDLRSPAPLIAARLGLVRPAAALSDAGLVTLFAEAGFDGRVLCPGEVPQGAGGGAAPRAEAGPDDWRAILFTSGTTGRPKGVIVTERMVCAAGHFAGRAARADGDQTFLLWEPLNHIGGAQMIPAALLTGARLALVPRFSASRFWEEARAAGATRIHYLGGVLDLLAKQPPGHGDRAHSVTLGFGAGARPDMWRLFPERFGVELIEVYGQTEAASFCVVNAEGYPGAIGRPLDEFAVELLSPAGSDAVAPGTVGEIAVRSAPPGLLTPGYFEDETATAAAFRDGWFRTGDLARRDAGGRLHFMGRVKEAIRRRGENVSALEVETAIAAHPAVEECAVLGVPAEIGEEDILAVLTLREAGVDPAGLIRWLSGRLAPSQLPRYVRVVESLPHTPSHRIAKAEISREIAGDWDAERR